MKETDKRIKTAVNQAISYRNYRRIRDRALRRLGRLYPDQYREFLEEERAKDEANGKAWLDISGTTATDVGFYLPPHRSSDTPRPKETYANQQGKGNNGGEA